MRSCNYTTEATKKLFKITSKIKEKTKVKFYEEISECEEQEMEQSNKFKEGKILNNKITKWADKCSAEEEQKLHHSCAKIFYKTGIPFRVADSSSFIEYQKQLRPAYKPPTARMISGSLLNEAYLNMVNNIFSKLENCNKKFSIVSDGWSNIRNESLINFVLVSPQIPPILFRTLRFEGEQHTAENIAKKFEMIIDEIGEEKISGIVTDNASNMRAAWRILEQKFPSLVYNGCSAHTINLMVKDICLLDRFALIISKCAKITKFINNRSLILHRFMKIQEEFKNENLIDSICLLSLPCETRWCSHYQCIQKVDHNKLIIKQLSNHPVLNKVNGQSKSKKDNFQ